MKKYNRILLDVDGTLLDFDQSEREGFGVVLRHYGLEDSPEAKERYHQINKEYWEAFEAGTMSREDVQTKRFERFFGEYGLHVRGREAEEIYREQLDKSAILIPFALKLCQYLSGKYEIFVVSNGFSKTQHCRLKASGLYPYFKQVFVSEDTGSQKPQREFFDYCFSKMENPDRTKMLLVGDSLTSDIKGGNNAGVDTCWYNPEGSANDRGVSVNYEIRDLRQLARLL